MRRLVSVLSGLFVFISSMTLVPALAGTVDDYIAKAQVIQDGYAEKLDSTLIQEGLTCVKFTVPSLPTFTDDVDKNNENLDSYTQILKVWLSSSITTARTKCVSTSPSPTATPTASTSTSAAAYTDKAKALLITYQSKIDDYAKSVGCPSSSAPGVPTFYEGDDAKNITILDSYLKSLDSWFSKAYESLKAGCATPSPSPTTSSSATLYKSKAVSAWSAYQLKIDDLAKSLSCGSLPAPEPPVFTDDEAKNLAIYDSYLNTLNSWLVKATESIKAVCNGATPSASPSPILTVTDTTADTVKAKSVRSAYQAKVYDYAKSISCTLDVEAPAIPSFTTNYYENEKIFNDYQVLLGQWYNAIMEKIKDSCPVTAPPLSEVQSVYIAKAKDLYQQAINNDVQIRKDKGIYCFAASPPSIPDFTKDENQNIDILNVYALSLKEWLVKNIDLAIAKCVQQNSQPTITEINSNQGTKADFEKAVLVIRQNSSLKLAAMIDSSRCPLFVEISQPATPAFSDNFESNVKIANSFVAQMDAWISDNYSKWLSCVNANRDYQAEAQTSLNGLNEKLKFYITYYKCKTFSVNLPMLPSIIEASNFDSVLRQIGIWYDENFKRVQIECQDINLDYLSMAKQLLTNTVKSLDDIVIKNGCKKIQYSTPPVMPTFNNAPHQNLNDFEVYKAQLVEWQNANLSLIKRYCQSGNLSGEDEQSPFTQKTLCINSLSEAKIATQYTQANITLISDIWSSSQKLIGFITTKQITYEQANSIYQTWASDEYTKLLKVLNSLVEIKGACGNYADIYPDWSAQYQNVGKYINSVQALLQTIQMAYKNIYSDLPKLVPQIGNITQIVGGCQVQILNYDPTFNWYAKGNLVIDSKGLGTITQSGGQEYLSTSKPGYQTFNYIDKIFACTGVKTVTSIDAEAPKLSLLSLSSDTIYKGQAVTVTFLVTDNKEVNSVVLYLIDPVGTVVDRYEGTALAKRIKGDANVGVYQVDLYARMISYEGKWKIWAMARDLNSNVSDGIDLAFVMVKNSTPPSTSQTNEKVQLVTVDTSTVLTISTSPEPAKTQSSSQSSETLPSGSQATVTTTPATPNITTVIGDFGIKSTGSIAAIRATVTQVVTNAGESAAIVKLLSKLDAAPVSTSLAKITLPDTPVVDVLYKTATPKVCSVRGLTVIKKSKGTCLIDVTTIDSDGNSFVVQKKIVMKK